MSEVIAGYQEYIPSRAERLRRARGFKARRAWFDEEPPGCPYWAKTRVAVRFSMADRLRLLITGAVDLELEHRSDVQIGEMITKTSVVLIGPGDERVRL